MLSDDFFLGTKLHRKKFIELCKPLAKYLGITEAIYLNIDKNGGMFSIASDAKWWERLLEEQYYKIDPIMVHPDNVHNGFSLDDASEDQEFKDTLIYDATINFNCWHTFQYFEKINNNGSYFCFGFATSKNNYQIISRLINEAHIIKKFIRNLNNKLIAIINKDLLENRMDFAALKGDAFYTQKALTFNATEDQQNKINLLKETGFLTNDNEGFFTKEHLSSQEIKCLRLYLGTRSIKKVSRDLNLALTTVTSYIENIKVKLNCNNKNELFEKAEILECLGRI